MGVNRQQLHEEFDPTRAPAWEQLTLDSQQRIAAMANGAENFGEFLVVVEDDDNLQAEESLNSLKEVFLHGFATLARYKDVEPEPGPPAQAPGPPADVPQPPEGATEPPGTPVEPGTDSQPEPRPGSPEDTVGTIQPDQPGM